MGVPPSQLVTCDGTGLHKVGILLRHSQFSIQGSTYCTPNSQSLLLNATLRICGLVYFVRLLVLLPAFVQSTQVYGSATRVSCDYRVNLADAHLRK